MSVLMSTVLSHRRTAITVLALAIIGGAIVFFRSASGAGGSTDPIITKFNDSITTYLADATLIQDVRPRPEQRGVGVDGSLRARPAFPMHIAGNAFEPARGNHFLASGIDQVWQVDLALPAKGFPWVIGRSYNVRQDDSGHHDSNGPQGNNWFQVSQPEIVLYEAASDEDDVLYLVYGADRYVEFRRQSSSSTYFIGTNGAAGVFSHETNGSDADTFTLTDQFSYEHVFFGFDTASGVAKGQLWKIADPAGNTAYVGDESDSGDAITNGFTSDGYIEVAYDTSERRYTYGYTTSTLGGVKRLEDVIVEVDDSGWAEVARVEYEYYEESVDATVEDDRGEDGDLKIVRTTVPMTDASNVDEIRETYLVYYDGTFNANTNPGTDHHLRLIVGEEGCRKYDWTDSTFDADYKAETTANLEPYAVAGYEYDSSTRIVAKWAHGQCGCGGGSDGESTYTYGTSGYTDDAGYDNEWASRVIVTPPTGGAYEVHYYDEVAQSLGTVKSTENPSTATDFWVTQIARDSDGFVTSIHTPANNASYTHSTGAITAETSAGLVHHFVRESSSVPEFGYVTVEKWSEGTSGDKNYVTLREYDTNALEVDTGIYAVRPIVDVIKSYANETTTDSGGISRTIATSFHSGTNMPSEVVVTEPAVSNNGAGTTDTMRNYFNADGTIAFSKSLDDIVSYRAYDEHGKLEDSVEDADTSSGYFTSISVPNNFDSDGSGDEFQRVTGYVYDESGRLEEAHLPNGRKLGFNHTKLADRRIVRLSYQDFSYDNIRMSWTYWGPVGYTVRNLAGKTEVSATIGMSGNTTSLDLEDHYDTTDDDPITAADLASDGVFKMMVKVYDDTGTQVQSSRMYHATPATYPGVEFTNYDVTEYHYDDLGRVKYTVDPTDTIDESEYDEFGRATSRLIGTDNDGGGYNMVTVEELEWDDDDVGNGLLTERTLHQDGSTTRVHAYTYDVRGNLLREQHPAAPHILLKYDNMKRRIASARYSSLPGATEDPSTYTTGRVYLGETSYDTRGRVYLSRVYPAGTASKYLDTNNWYDEGGSLAKRAGVQLTKSQYDRLGRNTHYFVLAEDNDASYSDAVGGVSGDHVLVENQTTFESSSDNVAMVASIERFHDDDSTGTTGALDSNADTDPNKYTAANLSGRIQITALWYDSLDRQIDSVALGTNDGSDYDRDLYSSAPARSATALRTTYGYSTAGQIATVTDPRGLVRKTIFEDGGATSKVIRNFSGAGTPADPDDNQTVAYEYTDQLLTKITADQPGSTDDQDTTYVYGVSTADSPGASGLVSNRHLRQITYEDSGTVKYAYNRLGERTWKKDQIGYEIDSGYDSLGRLTSLTGSNYGSVSGLDETVQQIVWAYDTSGRLDTVTQYDDTPAVVDQVQYSYDSDWSTVTGFDQDHNSAISGDELTVAYSYAKSSTGRETIRRSGMTLPSGTGVTYEYLSTGDSLDGATSRVTQVKLGGSVVAQYAYNGLATLVETDYSEPDARIRLYGATSGSYPGLDRFNRIANWTWDQYAASSVEFYSATYSYDENSNVTLIEDEVLGGYDVSYTVDDLDRLTRAQEGTWNGSSIAAETRDEDWDLTHVGGWNQTRLDLDADDSYGGTDEWDEVRQISGTDEVEKRDVDNDSTWDFDLTSGGYNANGNLVDDKEGYKYEYDAFGRLRQVSDQSDNLVAEYRYNGLGYMIAYHKDSDGDSDVDSNDLWYHNAYDDDWRLLAVFRANTSDVMDSDPKEEFLFHDSGLGDLRKLNDNLISRRRDGNTSWTSTSDGTLEQRIYYCQNGRGDVVALLSDVGEIIEHVRYTSYGTPCGTPGGDVDGDF